MSKETPWKNTSPRGPRKRRPSASLSAGSSPAPTIYIPPESQSDVNSSNEPADLVQQKRRIDRHERQVTKYTGDKSALVNLARLRGIDIPATTPTDVVKALLENSDVAWNSSSVVSPARTDYDRLYIHTLREIMQDRGLRGWATTQRPLLIGYLKEFDRTRGQREAPTDLDTIRDCIQSLSEGRCSVESEGTVAEPVTVKREGSPVPMPTDDILTIQPPISTKQTPHLDTSPIIPTHS